jgi:hypothetical protein
MEKPKNHVRICCVLYLVFHSGLHCYPLLLLSYEFLHILIKFIHLVNCLLIFHEMVFPCQYWLQEDINSQPERKTNTQGTLILFNWKTSESFIYRTYDTDNISMLRSLFSLFSMHWIRIHSS